MRASDKCSRLTFIEADPSHPMFPLLMLYIVTLTYIFNVPKFLKIIKYLIIWKTVRARAKMLRMSFMQVDIRYQTA